MYNFKYGILAKPLNPKLVHIAKPFSNIRQKNTRTFIVYVWFHRDSFINYTRLRIKLGAERIVTIPITRLPMINSRNTQIIQE